MSNRGVAPVVGVALLVAVTVVLAAVVATFALGVGASHDDAPQAAITAKFGDEHPNQINLTHAGGDPLVVEELTVRIFVDGEPLDHQPEVPFFSEKGFKPGPSGPFNTHFADRYWRAGEVASLTVARTTNDPQPRRASRVTVRLYVHGDLVATARV